MLNGIYLSNSSQPIILADGELLYVFTGRDEFVNAAQKSLYEADCLVSIKYIHYCHNFHLLCHNSAVIFISFPSF